MRNWPIGSPPSGRSSAIFLSAFTRIDTCNPPGDTTAAAALVRDFLDDAGIGYRTEAPQARMPNLISSITGGAGDGHHLVLKRSTSTCFRSATPLRGPEIRCRARSPRAACMAAARSI